MKRYLAFGGDLQNRLFGWSAFIGDALTCEGARGLVAENNDGTARSWWEIVDTLTGRSRAGDDDGHLRGG